MRFLKKTGRVLFSMKTAMILLLLLIIACVIGSVIPQGEIEAYYTGYYSPKTAQLISVFHLDDVFHSAWFLVLTGFLCVNLLGCNLIHAPGLVRRMKREFTPENSMKRWDGKAEAQVSSEVEAFFAKMGFRHLQKNETEEGKTYIYAVRNRVGIWGPWLTHLGMLIIIVGFGLGQMFTEKYTVYGVPGTTKEIGTTGYEATIDSFEMTLREDDTVEQYISNVTVQNTKTCASESCETSVNHPGKLFGMKVYQNSTGWAAYVRVEKDGTLLQEETLCAGEHMRMADNEDLTLAFNSFYPDFVSQDGNPGTLSGHLNNPAYLYTLYYKGELLGMNVLMADEKITIDDYTITFTNPQQYTLLQFKDDPFTGIALIGGILILAALYLAFYARTEELWAVEEENGTWSAAGRSRKGGILYHEKIVEKAGEL